MRFESQTHTQDEHIGRITDCSSRYGQAPAVSTRVRLAKGRWEVLIHMCPELVSLLICFLTLLSVKITDVNMLCWLMYVLCLEIVNILHMIKKRKQLPLWTSSYSTWQNLEQMN